MALVQHQVEGFLTAGIAFCCTGRKFGLKVALEIGKGLGGDGGCGLGLLGVDTVVMKKNGEALVQEGQRADAFPDRSIYPCGRGLLHVCFCLFQQGRHCIHPLKSGV